MNSTGPERPNSVGAHEINEKSDSPIRRAVPAQLPVRDIFPEHLGSILPLRRCGALVCRSCRVHSPSRHQSGCPFPRFDPCRSRWYWLSHYRAIKCVACESPADLSLVEGWILARETGGGEGGFGMPGEILSLLHIRGTA
jgi:hypothetical protein